MRSSQGGGRRPSGAFGKEGGVFPHGGRIQGMKPLRGSHRLPQCRPLGDQGQEPGWQGGRGGVGEGRVGERPGWSGLWSVLS